MGTVLNNTDFDGRFFIANATENSIPTTYESQATPNNSKELERLITEVEEAILINSIGLDNFKLLFIALDDLPNADQKWIDLVEGVDYEDKRWKGLKDVLIRPVYVQFQEELAKGIATSNGFQIPNSENALNISGTTKTVTMHNEFVDLYQECKECVSVSLYQFLKDNNEMYNVDFKCFRLYAYKNSFGL